MPHSMEEMMGMGKRPMEGPAEELPEEKEETHEGTKALHIEITDDGYVYKVMGAEGKSEDYPTDNVDELLGWIKDDLSTPHMKDEKGGFNRLVGKIMSRPGFKPKNKGQSKEEAASAIAASVKDKKYGKSLKK